MTREQLDDLIELIEAKIDEKLLDYNRRESCSEYVRFIELKEDFVSKYCEEKK